MTDLPPLPNPEDWMDFTLTAAPGGGGVVSIEHTVYHLRGLHKPASGILRGQLQIKRDPAWEAFEKELHGKVEG